MRSNVHKNTANDLLKCINLEEEDGINIIKNGRIIKIKTENSLTKYVILTSQFASIKPPNKYFSYGMVHALGETCPREMIDTTQEMQSEYRLECIEVTHHLKIDQEYIPLTRNYTWIFNDKYTEKSHPLQNQKLRLAKFKPSEEAINTVYDAGAASIHTMKGNINSLKGYAKQIWRKLLDFNPLAESIDDLKTDLGLFFYIHAHMMEASRGSAAIAEWKQKIITGYHGYNEEYCTWKNPDQYALAYSLDTFLPMYKDELILTEHND